MCVCVCVCVSVCARAYPVVYNKDDYEIDVFDDTITVMVSTNLTGEKNEKKTSHSKN